MYVLQIFRHLYPSQVPQSKSLLLFPFLSSKEKTQKKKKLYQSPAKGKLSEILLYARGTEVLLLSQILTAKHFSTPRQTPLCHSTNFHSRSESNAISRQAWVWWHICFQQNMCSASWQPGKSNQTSHVFCILYYMGQAINKSPINQVAKK